MSDDKPNGHDASAHLTEAIADFAERTLSGDMRDLFITIFRDARNPWYLLNEVDQSKFALLIEDTCAKAIRRTVQIVSGRNFPAIPAVLKEAKVKGEIEVKATLPRSDPNRHFLIDASGSPVLIILADPAHYLGARGLAKIDRQQPELPLAEKPPELGLGATELTPFELGTRAAIEGSAATTNPFKAESESFAEWHKGWIEGWSATKEPAPPVAAKTPTEPYTIGYEAGRRGEALQDHPFIDDSPEHARFQAGWLQSQIDGFDAGPQKDEARHNTIEHFRLMGEEAAKNGFVSTDNPFADWMPAFAAWDGGFFATTGNKRKLVKRGRPPKPKPDDQRPAS